MITQVMNALGPAITSLLNLVPRPDKLTMIPVLTYAPVPIPSGLPYSAMINPEKWQKQEATNYFSARANGSASTEQRFRDRQHATLSFDLVIDGTGASGDKRDVADDVDNLKKVTGWSESQHRPNKLIIVWGRHLFNGVLTTFTVNYTLFKPDGRPLRATVSLSFQEDMSAQEGILKFARESPDLTHRRLVKSNDRIDLLCHQTYGDSRFYLELAEANKLTSFRALPEGQELIYPPVEK